MRQLFTKIFKGHAIRRSPYSLEALSLSQGLPSGVLTPRVRQTSKTSQNVSGTLGAWRCVLKGTSCNYKLESINLGGLENIELIRPCQIKIIN